MSLLTDNELKRIEKRFAEGIGSADVVQTFQGKGERFSEATLRKYVQLGLLPKSRRVGSRGRHKGSTGLYPVEVVRQINDIKRALSKGATLGEIRVSRVALRGEIQGLERASGELLAHFDEAVGGIVDKNLRMGLKKELAARRRDLTKAVRDLGRVAKRIEVGGARS